MIELVQIPKENTNIVWKHCEGMIADFLDILEKIEVQ